MLGDQLHICCEACCCIQSSKSKREVMAGWLLWLLKSEEVWSVKSQHKSSFGSLILIEKNNPRNTQQNVQHVSRICCHSSVNQVHQLPSFALLPDSCLSSCPLKDCSCIPRQVSMTRINSVSPHLNNVIFSLCKCPPASINWLMGTRPKSFCLLFAPM